ncbi:four-carbon acid sugar kinase family protein [Paenibacillus sp. YIM B09110]|uniref:four-carbon acid sugar kinase family protein n=1 Tax=Paenibacillus sp. YIM B09110 TaxID=3126102 RepID=UPI00301CDE40
MKQRSELRPLLSFYGDDFTGSTDVLETLFQAGVDAGLFIQPPTSEQLNGQFANLAAFGVAGISRSLSPEEMDLQLTPIFKRLHAANTAIVHYKICSTFDSAPQTGSIGKAAELGRGIFGGRYIPLLAGAPHLRRFTLFGHHFAAAREQIHRLDRHPTMSRHPVTPMEESDLRLHLQKQTSLRISLMDIVSLDGSYETVRMNLEQLLQEERPDIVIFDALDDERMETVGRLIWEEAAASEGPLFVIGSSGVEQALAAHWQTAGIVKPARVTQYEAQAADRQGQRQVLVLSGSCSPVTAKQITYALAHGFSGIRLPVSQLLDPSLVEASMAAVREQAMNLLKSGKSVILYTASGPDDPEVANTRERLAQLGIKSEESSRRLGPMLGKLATGLIEACGLNKLVIAGGDTSGYIVKELDADALGCDSLFETGSPLCQVHAKGRAIDGLKLILKGGQVGGESYFVRAQREIRPENNQ